MTSRTTVPAPAETSSGEFTPAIEDDARHAWRMIFAFAQAPHSQLPDPPTGEGSPGTSRRLT